MLIGTVVGSVVSTRKCENLIGNKFMIIDLHPKMAGEEKQLVAVDPIGAGIGEVVLIATGSAARIGCDMADTPVDAAIVGIIDKCSELES